jgi:transposase
VVLGLLIDEKGVPFSWDIFNGNQADAPTLIKQIQKLKERFCLDRALLVFDRGFLSNDNLRSVGGEIRGVSFVKLRGSVQVKSGTMSLERAIRAFALGFSLCPLMM